MIKTRSGKLMEILIIYKINLVKYLKIIKFLNNGWCIINYNQILIYQTILHGIQKDLMIKKIILINSYKRLKELIQKLY